jgi:hypothetical protein
VHLLGAEVVRGERGDGPAGLRRLVALGVHRVDEHEAGLLLERHLRDEVGDALVDRPAPVLVRVQGAVVVQVLELVALDGQDVLDPPAQPGRVAGGVRGGVRAGLGRTGGDGAGAHRDGQRHGDGEARQPAPASLSWSSAHWTDLP